MQEWGRLTLGAVLHRLPYTTKHSYGVRGNAGTRAAESTYTRRRAGVTVQE